MLKDPLEKCHVISLSKNKVLHDFNLDDDCGYLIDEGCALEALPVNEVGCHNVVGSELKSYVAFL